MCWTHSGDSRPASCFERCLRLPRSFILCAILLCTVHGRVGPSYNTVHTLGIWLRHCLGPGLPLPTGWKRAQVAALYGRVVDRVACACAALGLLDVDPCGAVLVNIYHEIYYEML